MKYEPHPDGGNPYLVVSPEEIVAMSPWIKARLRRYGVRDGDVDDLCQDVIIAAHEVAGQKGIRGPAGRRLEKTLRAFLEGAAWLRASNYRRLYRNRYELTGEVDPALVIARGPEGQIEAREVLSRAAEGQPTVARDLLLLGLGLTMKEGGEATGASTWSFFRRAEQARAVVRKVSTDPAPKQAPRPTWKSRKRRR